MPHLSSSLNVCPFSGLVMNCSVQFFLKRVPRKWGFKFTKFTDVSSAIPVRDRRCFFSPKHPGLFWGPPSPLLSGSWRVLSPMVNWPGYEADHSPPCSAAVKNEWSYTSDPTVGINGICRGNSSFYLSDS